MEKSRSPTNAEDLKEIRLQVRKTFQIPPGLDDPKTVEKALLSSPSIIKELKQKHAEEIADLQDQIETLEKLLKETRDNSIKFFETTVQEKNFTIQTLQESQKETNRLIAELSTKIVSAASHVSHPSFTEITEMVENIFATALLETHDGNFTIEVDDIKIWVCLSSADIFTCDEDFHRAITGAVAEKQAKGVLFLAPDKSCRLIHGATKVFFEYSDNIPVIYLRNGGCGNAVVLQTCITMLMKLSRHSSPKHLPDTEDIIDPASFSKQHQRRSRLPKKSLDEIVAWMRENANHEITAPELCDRMGISTRNVNDLGGIGELKKVAYGITVPKRGRARGGQLDDSAAMTIMIEEEHD